MNDVRYKYKKNQAKESTASKQYLKHGYTNRTTFQGLKLNRIIAICLLLLSTNTYTQDISSELLTATRTGDTATVISLLDKGVDINSKDIFGITALMYAVKGNKIETVKILLNRGADVNVKSKSIQRTIDQVLGKYQTNIDPDPLKTGHTALLEAVYWGYTEIVEILLDACADVNIGNENGTTPLEVAAITGHTRIAELLIKKGADVDVKSRFGNILDQVQLFTPIEKRSAMIKILTNAGSISKSQSPKTTIRVVDMNVAKDEPTPANPTAAQFERLKQTSILDEFTASRIAERCLNGEFESCQKLRDLWSWEPRVPFAVNLLAWLAVPGLIGSVSNPGELTSFGKLQAGSAFALGMLKDHAAVTPLLIVTMRHRVSTVRESAANALREIGDEKAIDALIDAATTEHDLIYRRYAVEALGYIGDPRSTDALRTARAYGAKGSGVRDLDDLRLAATNSLANIGDRSLVPQLLAELSNPDHSYHYDIVGALGRIGDSKAVKPLIQLINKGELVSQAADALGLIGDARAIDPLIRLLSHDDWSVRSAAITSLQRFNVTHTDRLIAALEDDDSLTRSGAAEALADGPRSKKVADALLAAFRDRDRLVRTAAAKALASTGDQRAIPPLIAALCEDSVSVRIWSAHALGEFRDQRAVAPLLKRKTRLRAQIDKSQDDFEMNILLEESAFVEVALKKLGRGTAPFSIDQLITKLQSDDEFIRLNAAVELVSRDDSRALKPLREFLSNQKPETRQRAAEALATSRLGFDILMKDLSSRDNSVQAFFAREAAARAIARVLQCAWPTLPKECTYFRTSYTLPLVGPSQ